MAEELRAEDDEGPLEDIPLELIGLLPDPNDMSAKEYLYAMGEFCVHIHNTLPPAEISKIVPFFCSPRLHVKAGDPEHYMLASSRSEYLSNIKNFRKANPEYKNSNTNLTVEVDEQQGEAILIATVETQGLFESSEKLVRQSVLRGHWRRTKSGRWYGCTIEILRGPGFDPMF